MIPLFKPYIDPACNENIKQVLRSGNITEGEWTEKFEIEFGKRIYNPLVATTNTCTSALHLAGICANIQRGDEICITAMSCFATHCMFYHMGANFIWVDIDTTTGNISTVDLERKITKKTKAVVFVDWGGNPANLDEINRIAHEHGAVTIEDAAHACGAEYACDYVGNFSDYTCFSFQAIKHVTGCSDGGLIVCQNPEDIERIKKIRWYGLDRKFKGSKWTQDIPEVGYKYHMSNVNAAAALANLKNLDFRLEYYRYIRNAYDRHINNHFVVTQMAERPVDKSANWLYSMLVDGRDRFIEYMKEAGIMCDRVHVRCDQYSCFSSFDSNLPNTTFFDDRLVNIPIGWHVSMSDVSYIIETINKYEGK